MPAHSIWCLALFLSTLLLGASATASECTPPPLDILLTNDDGYDTPGIAALHEALAAAGHRVKRVAPSRNFSGSSASLTLDAISARPVESGELTVYAVDGSPATTVLLGAAVFFSDAQSLDLVVSGINQGANLGPAANFSGTVGATMAGLRALVPAVAGIAVSTNPLGDDPASTENLELSRRIAGFVTRLVAHLQSRNCAEGRVLPNDMALNVNYPPGAKAVRLATQGRAPFFSIGFTGIGEDRYAPEFGPPSAAVADAEDADTVLFNDGYVTVVPMDGDLSINGAERAGLDRIPTLAP